jgi:hypothetical protein
LPERFRFKVTTIEESKDLEEMKIEELVGTLQTYELSLPPVKKVKTIAFKASKKKAKVSSEEDSEKEEDAVAMLAKNFGRLIMRNDRFKKKFSKKLKKVPREFELEEATYLDAEYDVVDGSSDEVPLLLGLFLSSHSPRASTHSRGQRKGHK